MNSYMRQSVITSDQMHNFIKDKQAWENAIALYHGPDPLDHWYNYVCWYESHGHGDPENKFRETLERCLTLYEHSDYYKQDARMVRLWLKYIDMQPNPLHFYQVLYQRGMGRQVAAFYIGWAGYYESINALKEAESVFNLGFQEKAQTYEELHHAYTKFVYAKAQHQQQQRQVIMQSAGQQHQQQQQQQQQQQSQMQQHQQPQEQHQTQQSQPQQQQTQIQYQQNHQQQVQVQQQHRHLQEQDQLQVEAAQIQNYRHQQQQASFQAHQQQQQTEIQLTVQQQQPQQNHHPPQQQVYHQQVSYQQVVQQQPQHLSNTVSNGNATKVATYAHTNGIQYAIVHQQQHQQSATSEKVASQLHSKDEVVDTVPAIKLPKKFASYCHNNFETWKPALFLEEPADPCRRCHYAKEHVYPGTGEEFSPEEIRARRYLTRLEQLKKQREIYQQPQTKAAVKQMQNYYNDSDTYVGNNEYETVQNNYSEYQQNGNGDKNDNEDDEVDDEDQEEEEDEVEAVAQYNGQQSNHRLYAQSHPYEHTNGAHISRVDDDLEEQIQASTITFKMQSMQQADTPNKTIKIKFKKHKTGGDSLNDGNYSAYTIERIYQPEAGSLSSIGQEQAIRKNGHSFHPYMMSQTSTPKTSSKRSNKTKMKRFGKFQMMLPCSSSNSSSADNVALSVSATENVQNYDNAIQNATFNDNANYSFSSAAALDNSNCSISSAVGRLNFRDTSVTARTTVADFSTYQENSFFATQHDVEAKELRLKKALETIERHFAKEAIDPFNNELCRAFLTKLDFPGTDDQHAHYKIIQTPLPKIANTRTLSLPDGNYFSIDKEVGRGSYGSVYKATNGNTGDVVALKFQKPPNTWEIYICNEVLTRINAETVLPGLMDISSAIIAPNASLIATEFSPFGSLLDINNKIRQATTKVMHESLVMHFSAQICKIIQYLHLNQIIHADIKPDNFLLMRIPSTDLHFPSLRLIDFGCAIDMTLFPENTKFRKVIQTDGFTCIEMQEGRAWSYETDLFCIAGTVHVMLLGEYMQLQKRSGSWDIKQKLPRYLKKHVWTKFYNEMLNIKNGKLPNLGEMRKIFEEEAARADAELQKQIRTLSNILYKR